MLVEVEKDATGTKGPRLTGVIELSGDHIVYMPKGKYVAVSKKILQPEIRETWRLFGYEIKEEEEVSFQDFKRSGVPAEYSAGIEELRLQYRKLESQARRLKNRPEFLSTMFFAGNRCGN